MRRLYAQPSFDPQQCASHMFKWVEENIWLIIQMKVWYGVWRFVFFLSENVRCAWKRISVAQIGQWKRRLNLTLSRSGRMIGEKIPYVNTYYQVRFGSFLYILLLSVVFTERIIRNVVVNDVCDFFIFVFVFIVFFPVFDTVRSSMRMSGNVYMIWSILTFGGRDNIFPGIRHSRRMPFALTNKRKQNSEFWIDWLRFCKMEMDFAAKHSSLSHMNTWMLVFNIH